MASEIAANAAPAAFIQASDAVCRTGITHSGALIEAMVALLADHHVGLDAREAREAVLAREAEAPTFISGNVAMPHARIDGVDRPLVAVATSESGVSFANSDAKANLVFLVLTPKNEPAAYLKIAATVARQLKEPGFVESALAASDAGELLDVFNGVQRDHGMQEVCAADMMEKPPATLRETNSVKDAIDLIVRTGLSEIPVVDKEGDLVGVASADEVLSLCLPEYLLWMEDLSRFSNFEPFATLLRKESSTWLADIMSDDYASVSVDQPAIAVAEALARHDVGTCYVLDGARLAGVVTLPHFLNKVFRD